MDVQHQRYNFLVRMHNLPRNTSLCQILHFLWESVDFDPDEALIRAYSSSDAIIGFSKKKIADESVIYCNGRGLYGRVITLHLANEEDLRQVLDESKEVGPANGPSRLGRRRKILDDINNEENKKIGGDGDESDEDLVFVGLHNYSDSDSEELDLLIPDFFLKGDSPDTIDFNNPPVSNKRKAAKKSQSVVPSTVNRTVGNKNAVGNTDGKVPQSVGEKDSECFVVETSSTKKGNAKRKLESDGTKIVGEATSSTDSLNQQIGQGTRKRLRLETPPQPTPSTSTTQQLRPKQPPQPFASSSVPSTNLATNIIAVPGSISPASRFGFFQSPRISARLPSPASTPSLRPSQLSSSNSSLAGSSSSIGAKSVQGSYATPSSSPFYKDTSNFDVQLVISSQHCLLKWNLPEELFINSQQIEITGGEEKIIQQLGREKKYLQKVKAGTTYYATIQGFDCNGRQSALACTQYRAHFSKSELEKIMILGLRFCSDLMYQFDILHRCKPKAYFDAIYSQPDGKRLMMPYLKDDNGHPGCPINGMLDGFFFSALLQGDSLPNASPFGDVQMIVDVQKMLDFRRMNMYFADFYCNQAFAGIQGVSSALHYVTVVVSEKDSAVDKFCSERLIRLDPTNNKFLKVLQTGGGMPRYLTNSTQGLLVEIYYTQPISLLQAKKFREISTIGKGSSRPKGLPNNKLCKTCNLAV